MPVVLLALIVLWSIVRLAVVSERIAPPLYVVSEGDVLSPVVLLPVSVSPAIVKSPVVAVMLKIRNCCWTSIVSSSCPGPMIVTASPITVSPNARTIVCGVVNTAESKVIVSVPTVLCVSVTTSLEEIPPPANSLFPLMVLSSIVRFPVVLDRIAPRCAGPNCSTHA